MIRISIVCETNEKPVFTVSMREIRAAQNDQCLRAIIQKHIEGLVPSQDISRQVWEFYARKDLRYAGPFGVE